MSDLQISSSAKSGESTTTQRGTGVIFLLLVIVAILPVAAVFTVGLPMFINAAVAGGYLIQLALVGFVALHWRVQPRDPWIWLALLYGILQALTLVFAVVQHGSFPLMDLVNAGSKIIGVIVYAGMAQALVPSEKEMRRFLVGFLWLTASAIIVNLLLNAADFSNLFTVNSSYELDFSSFFANRNQFGYFLFLSILAHTLYLHDKKPRLLNIILMAAQVASLLLTMSRGALLALLLFVVSFAVFQFRERARFLLSFIAGGVIFVLAARHFGFGTIFTDLVIRPDAGLSGRNDIWGIGLEVWLSHNIVFGLGSFRGSEIAQEQGMITPEFHSFFVETLVAGGLAELLLLVLILAIVWSRLAKSPLDSSRRHLLFSAGLGIAGLSLVESSSLFTIGLVGTMFTVFMVTLPILYSNLRRSEIVVSTQDVTPDERSSSNV